LAASSTSASSATDTAGAGKPSAGSASSKTGKKHVWAWLALALLLATGLVTSVVVTQQREAEKDIEAFCDEVKEADFSGANRAVEDSSALGDVAGDAEQLALDQGRVRASESTLLPTTITSVDEFLEDRRDKLNAVWDFCDAQVDGYFPSKSSSFGNDAIQEVEDNARYRWSQDS